VITKESFQVAFENIVTRYPAVSVRYAAGDPIITAQIEAIYTGLAMLSQQIEVAGAEPYEKTRDSTILADAAMRGLVPKAKPTVVLLRITNDLADDYTLESGRTLLDSAGLSWVVVESVIVPSGGESTCQIQQIRYVSLDHVVVTDSAFYAIEIPESDDGASLASIAVSGRSGTFEYRERFINTSAGELVYHVEVNHSRAVFVRFGADGLVGYQPDLGEVIHLVIGYSNGVVEPAAGSHFAFEYLVNSDETNLDLVMQSMVTAGSEPYSTTFLRELAKYPSIYKDQVVSLGQFEFLVRRNFPDLKFLSVWNESIEEAIRGASFSNMNCLFVACVSNAGNEAVLSEPSPLHPVSPALQLSSDLSTVQTQVKACITSADDSYRVRFYTPVRSEIPIVISAKIPTSYLASATKSQIIERVLAAYGQSSEAARKGRCSPSYIDVYEILRSSVAALMDRNSDFTVSMPDETTEVLRPELWRYVSAASLSVTVVTRNKSGTSW
jgi:hypothetical protein